MSAAGLQLLARRCRSCAAPWATTIVERNEPRCPFCGHRGPAPRQPRAAARLRAVLALGWWSR